MIEGEQSVLISGSVIDAVTNEPVDGAKITFTAFESGKRSGDDHFEQNVYSGSNGTFNILVERISTSVSCILKTEAEGYRSEEKAVIISWSGPSYDSANSTFVVNECNFFLVKD